MIKVIFLDSGDTLIDESTQEYDEFGIVQKAELIDGAKELLIELKKQNYKVVMVADGQRESFENVYNNNGLSYLFDKKIYSSDIGVDKPDSKMFEAAFNSLNLDESEKSSVIMVGNNLKRDILGAKNFGIKSVLINWSTRYDMTAKSEKEKPDFIINKPLELLKVLHFINGEVSDDKK